MPGGSRGIQFNVMIKDFSEWSQAHQDAYNNSGYSDPLDWVTDQLKGNMQAEGNIYIGQNNDLFSAELM